MKLLLAVALLVQPIGCAGFFIGMALPTPHSMRLSPSISGTLSRSEIPEMGKTIRLVLGTEDGSCGIYQSETKSDANGRFSFSEITRIEWSQGIRNPWRVWALCLEENGRFVTAISLRSYAHLYYRAPRHTVSVTCNLSSGPLASQLPSCFAPRYAAAVVSMECACQTYEIDESVKNADMKSKSPSDAIVRRAAHDVDIGNVPQR